MKILKAIKKIFKLIIKTKLIILIVLISTPYKAIANIYEIKCEDNNISTGNNNMAMTVVYTFKKDLTILIIAHRLSTLKECDKIIKLEENYYQLKLKKIS